MELQIKFSVTCSFKCPSHPQGSCEREGCILSKSEIKVKNLEKETDKSITIHSFFCMVNPYSTSY